MTANVGITGMHQLQEIQAASALVCCFWFAVAGRYLDEQTTVIEGTLYKCKHCHRVTYTLQPLAKNSHS